MGLSAVLNQYSMQFDLDKTGPPDPNLYLGSYLMRKILSASMIAGAALLVTACGGGDKTTNTTNTTMGTDTYNSMDSMGGNAMGGDMMGGNMSGGAMGGGEP